MPVFKAWLEGQEAQSEDLEATDETDAAATFAATRLGESADPVLSETRAREEDQFWEAYTIWVFRPQAGAYGQPRIFITDELGKAKTLDEDPRLFHQFPDDEHVEERD